MKSNQIRAEVFNLEGMKVYMCKNIDNMDLSKLNDDIYFISYCDNSGNVLWTERFIKEKEVEYAYVHR